MKITTFTMAATIPATIAALAAVPALADPEGYGPGMWGHGMWGGGMGFFGLGFMILFWGLVIAGVVYLVRRLSGGGEGGKADALTILRDRFARGEIDEAEFSTRKHVLES